MKTENVVESHQTDIPYTFPAGHETIMDEIKTAKILTVEILTSNFERAIEHVEAASKRWRFITVFLAFERPSRLQWTRLHPLSCYANETQRGKCDK